ncbi:MAG: squalene/phytoene synthase family protein [Gammaproteobacteria bacterium]|nr:squalene/phytoene synthase family protein [Gammaproteobacteria bacterium]
MQAEDEPAGFPNGATPVGSARYYAVRFADADSRNLLALLLLWYDEIRAIAAAPRDPGVARLKLDWWIQELQRLQQRQARHPLSSALQAHGRFDAVAMTQMNRIIEATEAEITSPAITNDDAFRAACRHTGGTLYRLLAMLEGPLAGGETAVGQGTYGEAVERVLYFHDHPHRLPADLGRLHSEQRDQPALSTRCRQLLDVAAADLPAPLEPGRCNIADRLCALQRALHAKMQRQGFPVDRRLVDRPPIAHLWTAWRCRCHSDYPNT